MSIENPAVPLTALSEDDDTYIALTGGTRSASGVAVTEHKALGLSAVWRGVNLIAGDVGRHSFRVYKYVGEGLVDDPKHRAAQVMRRPNDYMTPFTFRQTLQSHALLCGNGYAVIERDPDATPKALLPLDPYNTYPVRVNGQLWYVSRFNNLAPGGKAYQTVRLKATDVLHIKGLGFDGLMGYSVIQILRETIGAAVAARDYGARYFKNDASPGVVLECPASMKETAIKNLRDSWGSLHEGVDNAHRPGILREGVKLVPYPRASAKDAQLLENRDFDAREIANILGVPPHKLGDPSRTAYNSLESENQAYQEDTLDRWFAAWQEEADSKLLTEEEKASETHTCRFDPRPIRSVPLTERGAYYSTAINAGWLNVDEVRAMENRNPLPDGQGQTYRAPVNLAPVGQQPAPDAPPGGGMKPGATEIAPGDPNPQAGYDPNSDPNLQEGQ